MAGLALNSTNFADLFGQALPHFKDFGKFRAISSQASFADDSEMAGS